MDVGLFFHETPISVIGPFHNRASKLDPMWGRRDTPVPNHVTASTPEPQQYAPSVERVSTYQSVVASEWSPRDVVQWMHSIGFEDDIVQKFFHNDISGSILLELQAEDLKELDIMSFGKRHRVMSSIQSLRSTHASSSTAPSSSRNSSMSGSRPSTQRTSSIDSASYQSCSTTDADEEILAKPRRARHHSNPDTHKKGDVRPGDSVSIVAIEQLLPKLHHCSKGEACRKWQKQQVRLARLAQDLPIDAFGGRAIVAGDPGNPMTAPNLLKSPISEITPSLVASSIAMTPGQQASSIQLSQERLKEVKPRDAQENVRNFLNFQSLDKLQTANDPATPPREQLSSPDSESPDSAKITPTLAENLRHLPRLQIPSMHGTEDSVFSDALSAQKTVTPSILSKRNQLYSNDRTAIAPQQPYNRGPSASPGDFYRNDPYYRQETPFSEADAPVTALPIGPVAREESQSVPPNMRFGNNRFIKAEPVIRPSSTKVDGHRRCPSALGGATLNPLKEDRALSPIETPDDLQKTPRAPNCRGHNLFAARASGQDDVTHSGWMKKRKTTRLLRHEWEDHHFTLKGTQLAMHNDDNVAQRNSKALEYIDVDDYAVACSSLASNSKLTAAFKKTVLKRRDSEPDQSAFGFSLIPAQNNNGGVVDRKAMFLNHGKSHHFAVKSRDERIDWMRELMLAKALKRGRENGAAVNINGSNMI